MTQTTATDLLDEAANCLDLAVTFFSYDTLLDKEYLARRMSETRDKIRRELEAVSGEQGS